MTKITQTPILYSFRRCPYAMRARMALTYSQQVIEVREVVLRDKPISMLELSPKGTVPVLVIDNKMLLEESLDIMLWALSKHDPDHWLPKTKILKNEMLALITCCDAEFKTHLDHYKYADRFPEQSADNYRQQGECFLRVLNQKLAMNTHLYGQNISLADIAIFPFIRQFAHVDKTWFDQSEYTHVKIWLAHLLDSPLFIHIMHKHAQWKAGDHPSFL